MNDLAPVLPLWVLRVPNQEHQDPIRLSPPPTPQSNQHSCHNPRLKKASEKGGLTRTLFPTGNLSNSSGLLTLMPSTYASASWKYSLF